MPEGHSPPPPAGTQPLSDRYPHTHSLHIPLGHSGYPMPGPWIPFFPGPTSTDTHTHRSKQVSLGAGPDLWSLQSLTLSQLLAPLVSPESIPHHPASLTPDYHGWTSALITNLSTHGSTEGRGTPWQEHSIWCHLVKTGLTT